MLEDSSPQNLGARRLSMASRGSHEVKPGLVLPSPGVGALSSASPFIMGVGVSPETSGKLNSQLIQVKKSNKHFLERSVQRYFFT